jgi:medium-chain acyl-[acyl-carrier-protein] hydrolase
VRLLCFPCAGAGASLYQSWIGALGPEIDVWPIELPGRESRWGEPLIVRMAPLVQRLVHDLESALEPPFSFFGHSMGAFIAFELARKLRRDGGPLPTRLIVSAARAPQIPDSDQPLHAKPDAELLKEIRRLNGIPASLLDTPDLVKILLPTLRADLAVCETYTYRDRGEPPLSCSVSAYGGADDHAVPRHFLAGWRHQTTADFNVRIFPGGHFFLQTARDALLRVISEELRIQGEPMNLMLAGLRSRAEQTVAVVWREVLGAEEIGLDDNIFDLGGTSIHVVQALGMLRDRLDVPLSVMDMFQHPTIRSLVHALYPEPTPVRAGDTAMDRASRQWKALEESRNSINDRRNDPHA